MAVRRNIAIKICFDKQVMMLICVMTFMIVE